MSNNAPSFLVVIKTPYPRYRCQARGNQHLPLVAPNASMARWGQQRSTPASLTLMLDLTRTADLHGPSVGHPWLRSRFTLVSPSLAMLRVPRLSQRRSLFSDVARRHRRSQCADQMEEPNGFQP